MQTLLQTAYAFAVLSVLRSLRGLPRQRRLEVKKVLPKTFDRKGLWSSVTASLEKRVRRVVALRHAPARARYCATRSATCAPWTPATMVSGTGSSPTTPSTRRHGCWRSMASRPGTSFAGRDDLVARVAIPPRGSPAVDAGVCRTPCRQDGALRRRGPLHPGRGDALGAACRHGSARPFRRGSALDRHGARRNRAQARRRGAARIPGALRTRYGCERVGILGLVRPHQSVCRLAQSV